MSTNNFFRACGNRKILFENFDSGFYKLFEKIFSSNTLPSVSSWLTACCSNFEITDENKQELIDEYQCIFKYKDNQEADRKFQIEIQDYVKCRFKSDENPHLIDFAVFLHYTYRMHEKIRYFDTNRNHNIFGFMEGFNLEETRVVIIGQDPSPHKSSSGYAFHGSNCRASNRLSELFLEEMEIAQVNLQAYNSPVVTSGQFNFDGWIEQKILMINSRLTYIEGRTSHRNENNFWDIFTDFIVKYISDTKKNIVFILVGKIASNKLRLIDQEKHKVLSVLHTTCPDNINRRPTWDWNEVLPFVNTNFYLYENQLPLVDWHSIRKQASSKVKEARFKGWETYFKDVKNDSNPKVKILQNPLSVVRKVN